MQRGYPVMSGCVVSAIVFQEFLETIRWLEPLFADLPNSSLHLDVDNSRQLQAVAQQIRQAIQQTALPEDWVAPLVAAVQPWQTSALILRPSLTLPSDDTSMLSNKTTGLLESQVCWAKADSIADSLKRTWAELFRARSLLYWQRQGVQLEEIALAVLVQPLRSAIASGDVQFNHDIKIQATWGLGRALVTGEVIPDVYHVHRQTGLMHQQLGNKTVAYQVVAPVITASASLLPAPNGLQSYLIEASQQNQYALSADQLEQLIDLTQTIAADLGGHLRLEWTLSTWGAAAPSLWITQAMPQPLTQLQLLAAVTQSHTAPTALPSIDANPSQLSDHPGALMTGLPASGGKRSAKAWVVADADANLTASDICPGAILVVASITPGWLDCLKQASGLITEQGGMTSHGAIVARELGIPAVVGVANATQLIQTGEVVIVDGDRGEVYRAEPSSCLSVKPMESHTSHAAGGVTVAPVHATPLLVNLSQPEALDVAKLPVDGVGLLRSEFMLTDVVAQFSHLIATDPATLVDANSFSQWGNRMAEPLRRFAQAFYPRPVFYRSLDLRSHEYRSPLATAAAEPNPILGLHGALSYQKHVALFNAELTALRQVQQSGYTNVNLILPFVRTVEEFRYCRDRVIQAELDRTPHFQLWIMAEVPSVLFLLNDYVKAGVQGISIGSNDLTQLLLGVDRDHPQMADAYDQRHPVVLQAIRQLIETAKALNIPCSICGEAPSLHPDLIDSLVQWGITSISVNPDAIEQSRWAIVRAEQRLLLEAARQLKRQTD
jgi:pyruvate,water dikinase